MSRVKLKIKRLETIDCNLEAYAKRKSGIEIKKAIFKEEEQKARVKELEVKLKKLEADSTRNQAKDLKNQSYNLAVETKNLEASLEKQEASLPTTSKDRKAQTAVLKKHVKKRGLLDEISKLTDDLTLTEKKKLAFNIDTERAKAKKLEQDRKEIEKGAYQTIKEVLRKVLAIKVDIQRNKATQVEQDTKEIEKRAYPASKEGLGKKLDSDVE